MVVTDEKLLFDANAEIIKRFSGFADKFIPRKPEDVGVEVQCSDGVIWRLGYLAVPQVKYGDGDWEDIPTTKEREVPKDLRHVESGFALDIMHRQFGETMWELSKLRMLCNFIHGLTPTIASDNPEPCLAMGWALDDTPYIKVPLALAVKNFAVGPLVDNSEDVQIGIIQFFRDPEKEPELKLLGDYKNNVSLWDITIRGWMRLVHHLRTNSNRANMERGYKYLCSDTIDQLS